MSSNLTASAIVMSAKSDVLRVSVGGPVGSGKVALVDSLCKPMHGTFGIAVVTNDIYTKEDCDFLIRSQALPAERIRGVETAALTLKDDEIGVCAVMQGIASARHE